MITDSDRLHFLSEYATEFLPKKYNGCPKDRLIVEFKSNNSNLIEAVDEEINRLNYEKSPIQRGNDSILIKILQSKMEYIVDGKCGLTYYKKPSWVLFEFCSIRDLRTYLRSYLYQQIPGYTPDDIQNN